MLNLIKHDRISKQISVQHDKIGVLVETCTMMSRLL